MGSLRPIAFVALVISLALFGCGGGDSSQSDSQLDIPGGHEDVQVIENWVDTLREGDAEGAAGYFALPSVVENGTPPVTLRTRADAIAFNRSLPCGARLLRARPAGRFIDATFRLTERPGGACGTGTGLLARTAFVIEDGKIRQWRRLPNPPGGSRAPRGPIV